MEILIVVYSLFIDGVILFMIYMYPLDSAAVRIRKEIQIMNALHTYIE